MKDCITLSSREGSPTELIKMRKTNGGESKTYLVKFSSSIINTGYTEDMKKFIDPSGGPMIVEGCYLREADATVRSITYIDGHGWVITFY